MERFFFLVLASTLISLTYTFEEAKPYSSLGDVICPDGEHACPSGSTCCKMPSGTWGCCPIASAVCCKDKIHCCPSGSICDVQHRKCIQGLESKSDSTPWHQKVKARALNRTLLTDVICDSFSSCPDGTTCCKLATGEWGCCPIPNAVCCKDHLHCCPSGTTCDVAHGKCVKKGGIQIGKEISAKVNLVLTSKSITSFKSVICPDKASYCPDGSTCCKLMTGGFGCCPMPRANCCKDHLHCCPAGSECDLRHSTCKRGPRQIPLPMTKKILASSLDSVVKKQICDDKTTMCMNGHGCCITVEGEWGCCPP